VEQAAETRFAVKKEVTAKIYAKNANISMKKRLDFKKPAPHYEKLLKPWNNTEFIEFTESCEAGIWANSATLGTL
jgi:hypothetical protein